MSLSIRGKFLVVILCGKNRILVTTRTPAWIEEALFSLIAELMAHTAPQLATKCCPGPWWDVPGERNKRRSNGHPLFNYYGVQAWGYDRRPIQSASLPLAFRTSCLWRRNRHQYSRLVKSLEVSSLNGHGRHAVSKHCLLKYIIPDSLFIFIR